MRIGQTVTGRMTYFGGPGESNDMAGGRGGRADRIPAISLSTRYGARTLWGWWRVRFPNGRTLILQERDEGPAAWTGNTFDLSYAALGAAGYHPGNFPNPTVTATFLGMRRPPGATTGQLTASGTVAVGATGGDSNPFEAIGSGALYALLFVALLGMGAALTVVGVNRLLGGAPMEVAKSAALASKGQLGGSSGAGGAAAAAKVAR